MSRVLLPLRVLTFGAVVAMLGGCAGGSLPTLGYADATASVDRSARAGVDAAPQGSWQQVPKGAFDHRDYSGTTLEVQRARQLINKYRAEKGLKPLKLNSQLARAAKNHSRDLAKWDRISHHGSDGSNPWKRVARTGYNARLTAENVGTGQITIDEVFKGWQDSPGHNKNLLLADAEEMGIALVYDPKTEFKTFWTLVLGAQM
ncbi:MAG: CAP domain-containing protein [Pseudomonadota bacterium]